MTSGGKREGAGRKPRPSQKAKCIWCGQITQEDRAFIIRHLTPVDRHLILMAAANTACSGRLDTSRLNELFAAGDSLPAKNSGATRRR